MRLVGVGLALALVSGAAAQGTYTRSGNFGYGNTGRGVSYTDNTIGGFTSRAYSNGLSSTTNRIGNFASTNYSNGVSATSNTVGSFTSTNYSNGASSTANRIGNTVFTNYTPAPVRPAISYATSYTPAPVRPAVSYGAPTATEYQPRGLQPLPDYSIGLPDPNQTALANLAYAQAIAAARQRAAAERASADLASAAPAQSEPAEPYVRKTRTKEEWLAEMGRKAQRKRKRWWQFWR